MITKHVFFNHFFFGVKNGNLNKKRHPQKGLKIEIILFLIDIF